LRVRCACSLPLLSSSYQGVQSFFASQSLHNRKNLKKNPAM
jgi:hypothetical protein